MSLTPCCFSSPPCFLPASAQTSYSHIQTLLLLLFLSFLSAGGRTQTACCVDFPCLATDPHSFNLSQIQSFQSVTAGVPCQSAARHRLMWIKANGDDMWRGWGGNDRGTRQERGLQGGAGWHVLNECRTIGAQSLSFNVVSPVGQSSSEGTRQTCLSIQRAMSSQRIVLYKQPLPGLHPRQWERCTNTMHQICNSQYQKHVFMLHKCGNIYILMTLLCLNAALLACMSTQVPGGGWQCWNEAKTQLSEKITRKLSFWVDDAGCCHMSVIGPK